MSRACVLLDALDEAPLSTSDLYARVGYARLLGLGLIPYHAFRAELAKLTQAGLAGCATAEDGSSVWWRLPPDAPAREGPRASPQARLERRG
jgi:hypothetical protein